MGKECQKAEDCGGCGKDLANGPTSTTIASVLAWGNYFKNDPPTYWMRTTVCNAINAANSSILEESQ